MFRSLDSSDRSAIEYILNSRNDLSSVGVSWTIGSILSEMANSKSIGFFNPKLDSFILYKDLAAVAEIVVIFSRYPSFGAARTVLEFLITSNSQVSGVAFEEVWLEVHEENQRAIRLYESIGFKKVSTRKSYYPDGKTAINYNLVLHK